MANGCAARAQSRWWSRSGQQLRTLTDATEYGRAGLCPIGVPSSQTWWGALTSIPIAIVRPRWPGPGPQFA
jgi:hypothetical protein